MRKVILQEFVVGNVGARDHRQKQRNLSDAAHVQRG